MIKLCVVIFALAAVAYSNESSTIATKLAAVTRNAVFQVRFYTVAIETQIVGCANYELKKVTTDEQKACIKKEKKQAIKDSSAIITSTAGVILIDLAHAKEDLNSGNEEKVKQFLDQLDYDTRKVTIKREFRDSMKSFIAGVQEKMEKCTKA